MYELTWDIVYIGFWNNKNKEKKKHFGFMFFFISSSNCNSKIYIYIYLYLYSFGMLLGRITYNTDIVLGFGPFYLAPWRSWCPDSRSWYATAPGSGGGARRGRILQRCAVQGRRCPTNCMVFVALDNSFDKSLIAFPPGGQGGTRSGCGGLVWLHQIAVDSPSHGVAATKFWSSIA